MAGSAWRPKRKSLLASRSTKVSSSSKDFLCFLADFFLAAFFLGAFLAFFAFLAAFFATFATFFVTFLAAFLAAFFEGFFWGTGGIFIFFLGAAFLGAFLAPFFILPTSVMLAGCLTPLMNAGSLTLA